MSIPLDNNQNQSILDHLPTEKNNSGGSNAIVLPPLGEPSRILGRPKGSSSRSSAGSNAGRHHHQNDNGSKQQTRITSVSLDSASSLHETDPRTIPRGDEGKGSPRDSAVKETETGEGNVDGTPATRTATGATVPSKSGHDGHVNADKRTQLASVRRDTHAGRVKGNGTGSFDHCGSVRGDDIGSTDVTNRCSCDNTDGGPTRDARPALGLGAPTACVSMPVGEAAQPSHGKRGGTSPFSPSSIRARVDGLRNRLALGWEAQASPDCPPRLVPQESSNQQHQPIVRARSPLSWLKLGRGNEPAGRKVSPVFSRASDADSNSIAVDRGVDEATEGGKPSRVECSSGGHHDRLPEGGDGKDGTHVEQEEAHDGPAKQQPLTVYERGGDGNGAGVATAVGTLNGAITGKDADATPAGKAADENTATVAGSNSDAAREAGEAGHKVLARNMTMVNHDVWPALLDNEADPAEWALDKGESEVLAAARTLGSILVRVVTWNLHAKPTPAAEELRRTLLPPGKVCF